MKIIKFEIDDSMSPEVFAHVRIDMGDRRILDIPKLKLFSYTHYVTVICASEKRELIVGPNYFELPKSKKHHSEGLREINRSEINTFCTLKYSVDDFYTILRR